MSRNTDKLAEAVSWRHVSNATVVHAPVAKLRMATFSGVMELAELPERDQPDGATGDEEMLCVVTWYEFLPERGAARVKISGDWSVERNYTGAVIDVIGRPAQ